MTNTLKETTGFKLCRTCRNEGNEFDRFCRRCGARQSEPLAEHTIALAATRGFDAPSQYATAPLNATGAYHTISRPLVQSVTTRLRSGSTAQLKSRWGKGVLLALISVPIWLMIILLSPLDAYAAARSTIEGN